jgi:hypothetical protein
MSDKKKTIPVLYGLLKEELLTISEFVFDARNELNNTRINGERIPFMCIAFFELLSKQIDEVAEIHGIGKQDSV